MQRTIDPSRFMSKRYETLLLLLILGIFLVYYADRFPSWFFFVVMLAVLGGTHVLAPDWLQGSQMRLFWWVCVAVAVVGLALELLSLALR